MNPSLRRVIAALFLPTCLFLFVLNHRDHSTFQNPVFVHARTIAFVSAAPLPSQPKLQQQQTEQSSTTRITTTMSEKTQSANTVDENQQQQPPSEQEQQTVESSIPLLPPPSTNDTSIPSIKLGETIRFGEWGPIILNTDGTTRRIENWDELTEQEKKVTWRRISKRNEERRLVLLEQQQRQEKSLEETNEL